MQLVRFDGLQTERLQHLELGQTIRAHSLGQSIVLIEGQRRAVGEQLQFGLNVAGEQVVRCLCAGYNGSAYAAGRHGCVIVQELNSADH